MEFAFTEEQEELRAVVRAFLAQRSRSEQVRAGFAPATWAQLIEQMELTAVALPEAVGGAGASFVEAGVALEETGRALLPAPYLPTVVGATALASAPLLQERVVGGAVVALALDAREPARPVAVARAGAGDAPAAPTHLLDGTVPHVLDGALAQLLVVSATVDGEPALFAVEADAAGVTIAAQPTLDGTRGQATVTLDGAPALRLSAPGEGAAALERLAGVLWVALAIEAVGSADRCLAMTVDYLRERVQFGRVLGTFQALRHRCADLAAELEGARATAHYAAWAVDGAPAELAVVAPLANAVCTRMLLHVAGETIQLHGGIGFTWEHDAHLYFKRAKASELLYGTPLELRRLAARRSGILEPAVQAAA
ncbi:acyl-CoA dehydrogenase family protein [Conexibacter stalactiti]|uniref:Acyl-CoA dehydrogenase family protein n=1 Tax=Conexibacter stalactiti TaxID=1940611 RepID=A0ABU4HHJ2_9ACTN|nr:acyl-CoA dehydrogenase family protein [Conexibacter stalactiti]MDW5592779.1 acyl-CoA dehydrogenase family protein [Conexibacter stalactiti]MEC5033420.1 acyl-CoA dehydrogenase family protein [Conexibacter stalactiti]